MRRGVEVKTFKSLSCVVVKYVVAMRDLHWPPCSSPLENLQMSAINYTQAISYVHQITTSPSVAQ